MQHLPMNAAFKVDKVGFIRPIAGQEYPQNKNSFTKRQQEHHGSPVLHEYPTMYCLQASNNFND